MPPIDTPVEALIVVREMGYSVTCMDVDEPNAQGEYRVVGRRDNGPQSLSGYCHYIPIILQVIYVSKDGSTRMGEQKESQRVTGCA